MTYIVNITKVQIKKGICTKLLNYVLSYIWWNNLLINQVNNIFYEHVLTSFYNTIFLNKFVITKLYKVFPKGVDRFLIHLLQNTRFKIIRVKHNCLCCRILWGLWWDRGNIKYICRGFVVQVSISFLTTHKLLIAQVHNLFLRNVYWEK